jgi:uncharacterized protein
MRRLLLLSLLAAAGGLAALRAAEVMPPVPKAYFNDYAGIVRPDTVASLNAQLEQFERATSNQILVVIYPKMQSDSSIEDYTERVKDAWGVGQKGRDNGAILFVFSQDRKLFIQVNYGLESTLPDALCKRIIDEEITPHFRQGDYDGGLAAGVTAILAATRGEYAGTGRTVAESGRPQSFHVPVGLIFFLLLIGFSFLRSRQQVVYRGTGRRSVWGAVPWMFLGGGGGGGGYGGGYGGGGGGFSGGGGGFSGGGGMGGGGGAGGSW